MAAIIGWELGKGGGGAAPELPCDPIPIVLVYDPGPPDEADLPAQTKTAILDVWGLDPRVALNVAFCRARLTPGNVADLKSKVTATIRAYQLLRVNGEDIQGAELPASSVFLNGGNLDADGGEDGAEIRTAAPGVRFVVEVSTTGSGWVSHSVVVLATARPVVPLVCPDLLAAIREGMRVTIPPSQRFGMT